MELTLAEIRKRTKVDPESGCWNWTGAKDRDGYGRWEVAEKKMGTRIAHRISFFIGYGWLPGWPIVVDHTCKNKACVNPYHLRPLNFIDNALLGETPDRRPPTCPRGHSRWRNRPNGTRECLDCRPILKKRYRDKLKA